MKHLSRAAGIVTALIVVFSTTLAFWDDLRKKLNLNWPVWWFFAAALIALTLCALILAKRIDLMRIKGELDKLSHYTSLLAIVCLGLAVMLSALCAFQGYELREVSKMNATYFAGKLPQNMVQIIRLIESASEELTILVDFPAYSSYSDPVLYQKYVRAIEDAKDRDVKLNIYAYDPDKARAAAEKQFSERSFEKTAKDLGITNSPVYKSWIEKRGGAAPTNKIQFISFLLDDDRRFVNRMEQKGIYVRQTITNSPPVYVWVRDHREAMLSFYDLENGPTEVSFKTTHPELIAILEQIAEQYRGH